MLVVQIDTVMACIHQKIPVTLKKDRSDFNMLTQILAVKYNEQNNTGMAEVCTS